MSNNGWIKLHRKIMDTPEWLAEPFTRAQAWVDLLLLANYETGFIRKRGVMIAVERGQVGYSEDALAARWKWSRGKVRRFLSELTRLSRIVRRISEKTVQKKTSVSGLIQIINYDEYQANSTENGTEDGRKTVQEQEEYKKNKKNILCPHPEIISLYNEILGGQLPTVRIKLWHNSASEKHLDARWCEDTGRQTLEYWRGLFIHIKENCPFLMGENKDKWKADFRWMVKKENFIKILEGKYEHT